MAKKLGFWSQALFGEWADRDAIHKNADDLHFGTWFDEAREVYQ